MTTKDRFCVKIWIRFHNKRKNEKYLFTFPSPSSSLILKYNGATPAKYGDIDTGNMVFSAKICTENKRKTKIKYIIKNYQLFA